MPDPRPVVFSLDDAGNLAENPTPVPALYREPGFTVTIDPNRGSVEGITDAVRRSIADAVNGNLFRGGPIVNSATTRQMVERTVANYLQQLEVRGDITPRFEPRITGDIERGEFLIDFEPVRDTPAWFEREDRETRQRLLQAGQDALASMTDRDLAALDHEINPRRITDPQRPSRGGLWPQESPSSMQWHGEEPPEHDAPDLPLPMPFAGWAATGDEIDLMAAGLAIPATPAPQYHRSEDSDANARALHRGLSEMATLLAEVLGEIDPAHMLRAELECTLEEARTLLGATAPADITPQPRAPAASPWGGRVRTTEPDAA